MKSTGLVQSIILVLLLLLCMRPVEAREFTSEFTDEYYIEFNDWEPLNLSLADTNILGNFGLTFIDNWRFAFEGPVEVLDRINLTNTVPVKIHSFHEIRQDPRWAKHGWFELTLDVDSQLVGRPYIINHRSHGPVRMWLNGVVVLENGNATPNAEEEVLSRFQNDGQVGIMFREGINHLLMEYSEHKKPRYFHFFSPHDVGIHLLILKHYEPFLRRYRAFLFGGAFMLLTLLVLMHAYLALKFKGNYHIFVCLTTFSMLILAFTTLSDTLVNWTYEYLYFYEFAYVISVVCLGYFYTISVRVIFELSVPWRTLHTLLVMFIIAGIISIYVNRDWLDIINPVIVLCCLMYVIYSLWLARRQNPDSRIGVVAGGLIVMALGAMLYLIPYIALEFLHYNHSLLIISVLMTFTGIPVSLTFNLASKYADLIETLEEKVEHRTADLELANSYQKRFFANISHEFRTPLTISEGLVNKLIRQGQENPAKAQYDLSVVKRNMARLNDMVNQIIDLTKSEQQHLSLRRDYFRADELAAVSVESFRSLAEHHGHTYVFRPDARDAIVHADRAKVEVIINNLISNAVKYTPDGGYITIETQADGGHFELTVRDSGPGIPPGQEEVIFERFHRLKRAEEDYVEGMGVGLELSRTLAQLHGGTIMAEPGISTGALFKLVLPLTENGLTHEPVALLEEIDETLLYQSEVNGETSDDGNYTILLVEDNEDMMHYVADVLSELGTVKLAKNGREALNLLGSFTPDLIITDLMMPIMGGQQLVENLMASKKWSNIPVVVLTAKALEEDKLHLLRIGVVDYVVKPFSPEQLLLKTRNLLDYYNRRKRLKVDVSVEESSMQTERLSDKTAAFIIQNISDVTLSVESIADALSQSRSSFYRNIQIETGMTAAEFIREVRLMAARSMVAKNHNLRLDELATAVGYKSATSFRKKYEARFGEHPLGD